MQTVGDRVIVKFDLKESSTYDLGSLELVRPSIWEHEEGVSDNKMENKVNKLLVNPQIATAVATNSKYKVAKGDKLFLHFMAWEWGQDEPIKIDNQDCHVINGTYILFKFDGDKIILSDDTFLGEVIKESNMTLSGLIISVEEKRKAATVVITHIPMNVKKEYSDILIGDTVKTIDDHQYVFTFNKKEYVKLTSEEIMGVLID